MHGGVRAEPHVPDGDSDRLAVFATYARGPLPREVVLTNERRKYPVENADGGLSACSDDALDAGAPCACAELPAWGRCNVAASETRVRYGFCSGHFDDRKKRIDDVRRACEPEGAKCNWSSILCCGGLRCEPGVGVCTKPPAK